MPGPHPGWVAYAFVACFGLCFCAIPVATSWGFDPDRYPLPGVICAWLLVMAMLDDGLRWLAPRLPAALPRPARAALAQAPLALARPARSLMPGAPRP